MNKAMSPTFKRARWSGIVSLLQFGLILLQCCDGSAAASPPPVPTVRLSAPAHAFVREPALLDASQTTGRIASYAFEFGDGSARLIQTDPFASHSYSRLGFVTALVTVTNSAGERATATANIEVDGRAPTASLATPPGNLKLTPISLDASASSDVDGHIVSYRFDPGDGTPPLIQTEPVVEHIYASAGAYDASVTVTDEDGLTNMASATVAVGLSMAPTTFVAHTEQIAPLPHLIFR